MKEKNIYELLNGAQVERPQVLEDISPEEKEKIKNNFKSSVKNKKKVKKSFLPRLGLVAAVLALFFAFTKPGKLVYSKIVDFYELMVNPIGKYAVNSEEVESSIKKVNKTLLVNGIELNIKEVLLDDHTLYFNAIYTVVDEDIKKDFPSDASLTPTSSIGIRLNGEKNYEDTFLYYSGGTIRGTIPDEKSQQQFYYYKLNKEIPLKDEDEISLVFNDFKVFDYSGIDFHKENFGADDLYIKDLGGQTSLTFKVKDIEGKLNTKTYNLQTNIKGDNEEIILKDLKMNPLVVVLEYERTNGTYSKRPLIFKAQDEKGQEYIFESTYNIMDEAAMTLRQTENSKKILDAKSLTFQGYYYDYISYINNNFNDKVYTNEEKVGDSFKIDLK